MASAAGTDGFVGGMVGFSSGVTRGDVANAFDLLKSGFGAPEAPATEIGVLRGIIDFFTGDKAEREGVDAVAGAFRCEIFAEENVA